MSSVTFAVKVLSLFGYVNAVSIFTHDDAMLGMGRRADRLAGLESLGRRRDHSQLSVGSQFNRVINGVAKIDEAANHAREEIVTLIGQFARGILLGDQPDIMWTQAYRRCL